MKKVRNIINEIKNNKTDQHLILTFEFSSLTVLSILVAAIYYIAPAQLKGFLALALISGALSIIALIFKKKTNEGLRNEGNNKGFKTTLIAQNNLGRNIADPHRERITYYSSIGGISTATDRNKKINKTQR